MRKLLVLFLAVSSWAQVTQQGMTSNGMTVTVIPVTSISFTTTSPLPAGTQGTAITPISFACTGGTGPYTVKLVSGALPAGISFSSPTLSGTPTASGAFSLVMTCTDSQGFVSPNTTFAWTINAAPALTIVTTPALADGVVGGSYNQTSQVVGGVAPYQNCAITIGSLPSGISVATVNSGTVGCNYTSGNITATAGSYAFTLQVCDSAVPQNCTTASLAITIDPAAVGCGGSPNFCSYTGTDIVTIPTPYNVSKTTGVPNLGALTRLSGSSNLAQDTSYNTQKGWPLSSIGHIGRCTDVNTAPGSANATFSGGLGGSDAVVLSSISEKLWHMNTNGGASFIVQFDPTGTEPWNTTGIKGCALNVITQNKNLTNPTTNKNAAQFGSGNFSTGTDNVWYGVGTPDAGSTGQNVLPYTFNPDTGTYTVGQPVADFRNGMPLAANTAAWAPGTAYGFGAYVSYTLQATDCRGGTCDWQSNSSVYQVGDIIVPTVNNPSGCAFKAFTITGPTGGTSPKWGSTCNFATVNDGSTFVWKGLDGPGVFIFQLTAPANGITSGQNTPAFVPPATLHPDLLTQVSDNGGTWTNVGVGGKPLWHSWGGSGRDDKSFASAFSTNLYGFKGDYSAGVSGIQGTGIFATHYDGNTNKYHFYNTQTGIMTDYTCSVPNGGPQCTGGQFVASTLGQIADTCRFFIHNEKMNADGKYVLVYPQTGCIAKVWAPEAPFNATTTIQKSINTGGHSIPENTVIAGNGQSSAQFGFTTGVYSTTSNLANPSVNTQPDFNAIWTVNPCEQNNIWKPYDPQPDCQYPLDAHPSAAFNVPGHVGIDDVPWCSSSYGINFNVLPPGMAWQGEYICVSQDGSNTVYRFTHVFNLMSENFFDAQFVIGELGQKGDFAMFTSNWGPGPDGSGTLGGPPYTSTISNYSISGNVATFTVGYMPLPFENGSTVQISGIAVPNDFLNGTFTALSGATHTQFTISLTHADQTSTAITGTAANTTWQPHCLDGFDWQPNTTYQADQFIHPVGSLAGPPSQQSVFQAVTVTGPSGAANAQPAWAGAKAVGSQIADGANCAIGNCPNGIIWQSVATVSNCRSDLFWVELK